jgi:hexosaminidase
VGPDGATVAASQPAGLFHGLQTLRQLLPSQVFRAAKVAGAAWTLPAVMIEDAPRFPWRGSHLDVGRHFLPMGFLKRHLDLMALHKLNVFHWHLTEDQGWRLELRRHPRLAQVGGWRRETVLAEFARVDRPEQMRFDHTPHGGFYTQDDVREIVQYAAERFITVVPEIELPGHSTAALAAYPELGNGPDLGEPPPEVATSWGVFTTVFNVEDATLAFLEDVYGFDPVPAGLSPAEAGHILGAQGQLWTEFVDRPGRAEYQLWPRLAALAEAVWSSSRDFPAFRARLGEHLRRLEILGVACHPY